MEFRHMLASSLKTRGVQKMALLPVFALRPVAPSVLCADELVNPNRSMQVALNRQIAKTLHRRACE